jgi:hypothetical protein
MDFFDCNCLYGRMLSPPLRHAITTEELLAEMDFCGVQEALVLASASVYDSPVTGNELVLRDTAGRPRLHPTWALLPTQCCELGCAEDFLARLQAAGVRALHAFPELHNYLLGRPACADLLSLLAENRVPLIVHKYDWQRLTDLLTAFPHLVLVQTGVGSWGCDRFVRPLVEAFPNFYFEISNYEEAGGLEDHCRKYGPERLLFGTNYPHFNMAGPRLTLLHADLPDADKQALAAGNLRRLLEEVSW